MRSVVKRAGKFACVCLVALLAVSCSPPRVQDVRDPNQPRFGGTLIVTMLSNPHSIDITATSDPLPMAMGQHVLETLFACDSRDFPTPFLLDSYDVSPDATEYVFRLRRGVLFHNGKEMLAGDVIASMRRWGTLSARGRDNLAKVKSIEALDPYTVKVIFNEPNAIFPVYLTNVLAAGLVVLPEDIATAYMDKPIDDIKKLIGTGPYRYVEFIPDVHVKMERFDDYVAREEEPDGWAGRRTAYVDTIIFRIVPDAMARLMGTEVGEYHFSRDLPADEYLGLRTKAGVDVHLVSPARYPCMMFNMSPGRSFSSPKLRHAALATLDMEEVLRATYGPEDLWRLSPGLGYPEQAWHSTAGGELYNQKDANRARALMAETGYQGETLIWIVAGDRLDHFASALAASAQLERVGFNIDLQVLDWPTLLTRRANPQLWDIASTHMGVVQDPLLLWDLLPDWPFPKRYDNEEMRAYREQLLAEPDFATRMQIWERKHRIFYQDVPIIKFGDMMEYHITRKSVRGYWPSRHPSFWNVWLAE